MGLPLDVLLENPTLNGNDCYSFSELENDKIEIVDLSNKNGDVILVYQRVKLMIWGYPYFRKPPYV